MASQLTVLLVTNEPELLDALGFSLNHQGYHVVPALTGDRAVELLLRQLPDLAVLDMLLPGQSGFQLTRLLKERSDGRVPVVMISDQTAPAHRDYAFAAGVDWFLEKWLAPSRLLQAVEMLCPLPVETRRPGSGSLPRTAATPA
jgi:DNA-binding response OmpR family regulator